MQKAPLPICTINFSNFKNQKNNNVTVYDNYLYQKFGYQTDDMPPMLTQLTSFHKPKIPGVIIMEEKD